MTVTWLAIGACAAAVVLAIGLARTRARLARVEATTRQLEALVHSDLEPAIAEARVDARKAATTARDAAIAAGVVEPPPRLPLEPVTGRVVRVVAFGAGARRALTRAASPTWLPRLKRSA